MRKTKSEAALTKNDVDNNKLLEEAVGANRINSRRV